MPQERPEPSAARTEPSGFVECRDRRLRRDVTWRLESTLATAEPVPLQPPLPFHPARALANPFVDAVRLDYRVDPSADASLALTACVSITGTDTPKLERAAVRVDEVLRAGFASLRPTYEFVPATGPSAPDEERRGTAWRLMPRGLRIESVRTRHAGFDRVDRRATPVVLVSPPAAQRGNVGLLTQLAANPPHAISLIVDIERIVLSEGAIAALDQSLRALRRGAAVGRLTHGGAWVPTDDAALSEAAQQALGAWLRKPVGYRLVCTVMSAGDARTLVDAGLMAGLYPGTDTTVERASDASAGPLTVAGHHAIDLRDCVTDIELLPEWLPDRGALVAAGVPRHYPEGEAMVPTDGIVLGRTASGPVRLSPADRTRHV
jgi:hypothetical protein